MMDFRFEEFKVLVAHLRLENQNSYLQTYSDLIQYFQEIVEIQKHHLVIGSHFVYGWMPTILRLDLSHLGHTVKLLNDVKTGRLLTP